jgi:hypothetical protein
MSRCRTIANSTAVPSTTSYGWSHPNGQGAHVDLLVTITYNYSYFVLEGTNANLIRLSCVACTSTKGRSKGFLIKTGWMYY